MSTPPFPLLFLPIVIDQKNTFGAVVFSAYGALWLGLGIFFFVTSTGATTTVPRKGMTVFWSLWCFFTLCMWLVTFFISVSLNIFFLVLAATFGCLIGGIYSNVANDVAGWFAVAAGAFAFYNGLASLVNEVADREIVPVGNYPKLYRDRVEKAKSYDASHDGEFDGELSKLGRSEFGSFCL
ncbi:GPR1/FUN34/yaaH family-domain-containing protein [Hyaloraphidium curvatum]|nr:GPR1/FUN34/yaaH family-domain-containing protein [Hyaloraphidium curvatum]